MTLKAWVADKVEGKRRVRAIWASSGIAVVKSLDEPGTWTLAHQPTGRKFPRLPTTMPRPVAIAVAKCLAAIGDWRGLTNDAPNLTVEQVVHACETVREMLIEGRE